MRKLFILLVLAASLGACEKEKIDPQCTPANRTGAICKDGTKSAATGSGTCSGHGGVETWICK